MKKPRRKKKSKSTKGALIKGMSRRLPSEILHSPLFKKRLREIMRHSAGIYALYRGKKLYYVGLTKNLHGRMRIHMRDKHRKKWDHFIIFRIQKVRYLKDIETLIQHIAIAHLRGNAVRGKVPRDADLNRILWEGYRENEKEMRAFRKALRSH